MFTPAPIAAASTAPHPLEDRPPAPAPSAGMDKWEIGRILLAGGTAGAVSAFVPYP